jgi:hypothetical protein
MLTRKVERDIPLVPIWKGPSTCHVLLKENKVELRGLLSSGAMKDPYCVEPFTGVRNKQ